MRSLLIIESDPLELRTISALMAEEYEISGAGDTRTAVGLMRPRRFDLVLLNLDPRDVDAGFAVLSAAATLDPAPAVVCVSACGDPGLIVRAGRHGAADFIVKPHTLPFLKKKLRDAAPVAPSRTARGRGSKDEPSALIGDSAAMRETRRLVALFGQYDFPVLILGESGTGKELAAREIHARSSRGASHLVTLNCGAIPSHLAESELFGTERGAFTGALSRAGAWERADGGTLFLDEVGDLAEEVQSKLLRALENGDMTRLGGCVPMRSDVRILAATNADIGPGSPASFRPDLLYRMNTLTITLAPLRERLEDIPAIVEFFAMEYCGGKEVDETGLRALQSYAWPGNVRQLRNTLCRAAVNAHDDPVISERHIRFDHREGRAERHWMPASPAFSPRP
ncbi:MAG: sigma-54 dependent transcriptional regulator [Spirochaetes bacterium]|nr:sigma-54 dependent transcriptional regulator [Spirochaetota bacterium]